MRKEPKGGISLARAFSAKEAKQRIEAHKTLKKQLSDAVYAETKLKEKIKSASDRMVLKKAKTLLEDVPVEELNRGKKGFRVKLLRDEGYESLADLMGSDVEKLTAIKGISRESAEAIRDEVETLVATTCQNVKLRLSADEKTPEANELVTALSRYRKSRAAFSTCRELFEGYGTTVETALSAAKPASGNLRWFFASGTKKQKAEESLRLLEKLWEGDYRKVAEENLTVLREAERETGDGWTDFSDHSVLFFNILEEVNPGVLGTDDAVYGLPEELAKEVREENLPLAGLRCELRHYQEWGVKYILHQGNVLLGDEMGLGKTVQAIAAMVALRNAGSTHFAVVCPASVLTNWCREIEKMSDLSVREIHGPDRETALAAWLQKGGVAVTTYETTGCFALPEGFRLSMLVVDEAHYIKNSEAQRTARVKTLGESADRLLFMTGTALENNVDEMVSLLDILNPEAAQSVRGMEYMAFAPRFREKVAPVYYRRRREDVLTELPELEENEEWCTLSLKERALYEAAVLLGQNNFAEIRRVSWQVPDLSDSCKAKRMVELIDEATSDGRKILVFSFFLDTIRKISALLGERCLMPVTGAVSPAKRQEILDEFEKAPAGTVLLAQIQSGGTGLNIQSASVVILCEPQFKPSIENQAISRAYRMGQTRNVLVYRLLCENTVDERIMERLKAKQEVFDAFADRSSAAEESLELDEKTFGALVEEEIERIREKNKNENK